MVTRCTRGVLVVFPEQECDQVSVHVCISLTLPLRMHAAAASSLIKSKSWMRQDDHTN